MTSFVSRWSGPKCFRDLLRVPCSLSQPISLTSEPARLLIVRGMRVAWRRNSDVYDSSELRRVPSWTDRIVYTPVGCWCPPFAHLHFGRGAQVHAIHVCLYDSIQQLKSSDHRPVVAAFEVALKGFSASNRLVCGTTRTVPRTSSSRHVIDIAGLAAGRPTDAIGFAAGKPATSCGGDDSGGHVGGGGGGGGGAERDISKPALTRRSHAPAEPRPVVIGQSETQVCVLM